MDAEHEEPWLLTTVVLLFKKEEYTDSLYKHNIWCYVNSIQ